MFRVRRCENWLVGARTRRDAQVSRAVVRELASLGTGAPELASFACGGARTCDFGPGTRKFPARRCEESLVRARTLRISQISRAEVRELDSSCQDAIKLASFACGGASTREFGPGPRKFRVPMFENSLVQSRMRKNSQFSLAEVGELANSGQEAPALASFVCGGAKTR